MAWLHGVGGSSRTILEAGDRYAAASLLELIGFEPEQFTSIEVARAMATQAYLRACRLAGPGAPVAGIGCTAAIATDRTKRGDHRCCVAACDSRGVKTYSLTLRKGRRTRSEEEQAASLLILNAVAYACGVEGMPLPALLEDEKLAEAFDALDLLERLMAREFNLLLITPEGHQVPLQQLPGLALLSGSFNPLHEGHRQLAGQAAGMLGQEVFFELPVVNADKAPLDLAETRQRLAQFRGYAPVILSRVPLFSQKAELFPHSVFVLGIDTVKRLVEPRFYQDDPAKMRASLDQVRSAGCRFLVAGRLQDDHFMTLNSVELPAGYRELFEEIPEVLFRADISSTAIRQQHGETSWQAQKIPIRGTRSSD